VQRTVVDKADTDYAKVVISQGQMSKIYIKWGKNLKIKQKSGKSELSQFHSQY